MKNDEWCELCGDKLKSTKVETVNVIYDVCSHCASLAVGMTEQEDGEWS